MWEHYLELVSDPAHLLVELTFFLAIDVVILGVAWPLAKRALRREHLKIDAEHGVRHADAAAESYPV